LSAIALLIAVGCATGGCSYQLGDWMGKSDKADVTGSVAPRKATKPTPEGMLPPAGDLAFARAAAQELLSHDDTNTSQPWENPQTGARGTVTPIATAYSQDGATCRDFLASYVREGAESWLQGEACRMDEGKWEVKTMRPWKRT
jgi:17 kDa outer membrane surface antigen